MFSLRVLALASLVGLSWANPMPAAAPPSDSELLVAREEVQGFNATIDRRQATEGVHLVNCNQNGRRIYSIAVYCPNDADCNRFPGSGNQAAGPVGNWEPTGSARFSTGVTFSWNIRSDAQNQPNYSVVGDARNGFRTFVVRKDDKHTMFRDGNGYNCDSIYYAL